MINTDAPETQIYIIEIFYLNFIYLPRIQKIAEPAPTIKSNGIQRQSTAKYCCDIGICRPENRIIL
jgi:hypothetical protein